MPIAEVFTGAISAVEQALDMMSAAVPMPILRHLVTGGYAYRYVEQTLDQALVLKIVRTASAMRALYVLAGEGLILDAGATMRVLDELSSDILFLTGPRIFKQRLEKRHTDYLREFFQEEFDNPDPIRSSQKRHRVSRSDIRAYVARTFAPMTEASVNQMSDVHATIENAYSGYVHGAAVHVMDAFDGYAFVIGESSDNTRQETLDRQFPQYLYRALGSVSFAAHAMGLEGVGRRLYLAASAIPDVPG